MFCAYVHDWATVWAVGVFMYACVGMYVCECIGRFVHVHAGVWCARL